ncbi:hypothetical protein [Lactiplantibacillus plantarum]|uniref:hypothetical protein n=1 Tax=Lactiplantibacillus plantarum TaxID=1590 RepID=UPI002D781495|nr:hypothetical protein [Lactiplantibacillus plantarum]
MITKFNRCAVLRLVLAKFSELVKEDVTADDVGMEAVRLNLDELDLRLIPKAIQQDLPLWVVVYTFSIDDYVAYAVVDDEQFWLFVAGIMYDGKLLCYLKEA